MDTSKAEDARWEKTHVDRKQSIQCLHSTTSEFTDTASVRKHEHRTKIVIWPIHVPHEMFHSKPPEFHCDPH